MNDIYEIGLTWQSRFTTEEKELFCSHYAKEGEWKQGDDGTWSPTHTYDLKVHDNPVAFKQMFPGCEVAVGEAVPTTQGLEIVNALRRMEQRLEQAMNRPPAATVPNKPVYESDGITRAAMPEWFIAHIRTVELRMNYCTDALQSDLDDGWHILAICPQPGQRRPDYILGKL